MPASRGTTSAAAKSEHPLDVRAADGTSDDAATGSHPRGLHARRPARGPASSTRVDLGLGVAAVLASGPSASRRPGQARPGRRPTSGGPAAWPAPGRRAPRRSGATPSTCRPSRICTSLISHSQPSTCRMHLVEHVLVRPVGQAQVVVQPGGLHQRPDLLADRGQLGRVERGDVGVLVEQLLEPGDVAVGLGPGHRRDEVVDERGVRPALGLGALAGVVDQERVDQRQVAERRVGAAGRRTSPWSCRAATPGCRACRGARSRRRRTAVGARAAS